MVMMMTMENKIKNAHIKDINHMRTHFDPTAMAFVPVIYRVCQSLVSLTLLNHYSYLCPGAVPGDVCGLVVEADGAAVRVVPPMLHHLLLSLSLVLVQA